MSTRTRFSRTALQFRTLSCWKTQSAISPLLPLHCKLCTTDDYSLESIKMLWNSARNLALKLMPQTLLGDFPITSCQFHEWSLKFVVNPPNCTFVDSWRKMLQTANHMAFEIHIKLLKATRSKFIFIMVIVRLIPKRRRDYFPKSYVVCEHPSLCWKHGKFNKAEIYICTEHHCKSSLKIKTFGV